ncbi:Testis-expressed sequence 10 [Liparis tanakae]|uniref:Testis-expressed sequence 10 n=1 Tax=Liparis tanakae TaxID=230148 RepID=A0A4Z2IC97_9TELE|nr:Testis-expressed sequence 10 [Liparis tanakae]
MKSKKKKRQDDFQKVKLKVGKTKPKADNATNTNFRSKGINLTEQLKKDTSGPTTQKNLSINDLLSQLHHHNANMKNSALVGLRELLSHNPSLLEQHLSRLISEVGAVFTDKDGNVRVGAIRVLSAHLTCAMSHIETSIQEDSIKILDVLLEHYPALLAARPAVLLTHFLELISHRQSSGKAKKAPDAKTQTWSLSINPNRAVTNQQWRLSVLTRLGCFLQAVVEERLMEESDIFFPTEGAFGSSGESSLAPLYLNWEELTYSKVGVKVYEHSGSKPTPHSTFRLRSEVNSGNAMGEGLDSAETVQSFAATLVPLLLEVWVEAITSDCPWNTTEGAHLLTPDAMSVMFQVLSILQLLRKLAPQREHQDALLNPTLSAQLIMSIQAAASRGHKELLNSLQTHACTLYDPQKGVMVFLPVESQQRMVQLLYFLPEMPQSLLANLSYCCTAGRISAGLTASLIRIVHLRSSFSGWSVGSQEAALQDVDYISFLFSTLTGSSSDKLASLQEASDDLPPSPLSPLGLYPTPLEQFTHHWDVVEEVCHSLESLGSKSQCFDILQNGICKYLTKLGVVPDSMAAGLLRAVSRLLDLSILPIEPMLRFLSQCCLSLLTLLITLEQELPTETNHKREAIWGACVSALSSVPRLLRMVLQSVRVGDLSEEELPRLGQILSMLLQHTPIHNQLLANAALLQEIMQHLTRYTRGTTREQWLTDLLYCYTVTVGHGSSARRGNLGLRDIGTHSLVIVSVLDVTATHVLEEGRSLTLGIEGGPGLRLGGRLQLAGERSSFSLVVWRAPGTVSSPVT